MMISLVYIYLTIVYLVCLQKIRMEIKSSLRIKSHETNELLLNLNVIAFVFGFFTYLGCFIAAYYLQKNYE